MKTRVSNACHRYAGILKQSVTKFIDEDNRIAEITLLYLMEINP